MDPTTETPAETEQDERCCRVCVSFPRRCVSCAEEICAAHMSKEGYCLWSPECERLYEARCGECDTVSCLNRYCKGCQQWKCEQHFRTSTFCRGCPRWRRLTMKYGVTCESPNKLCAYCHDDSKAFITHMLCCLVCVLLISAIALVFLGVFSNIIRT